MWIAKIRYKHDCILGNRCAKFKVALQSIALSVFKEKKRTISSSLHYMSGKAEDLDQFIGDLKRDKNVIKIERKGQMFFLLEKAVHKAVKFHTPKLIFVKPVLMDKEGYELWEVGSWERKEVEDFVKSVKKEMATFQLLRMSSIKIDNVYFPKLMPDLTDKQRRALELAIEEGYYRSPKKIGLRQLATVMGVSLATYQQHLQAAEKKLIPHIFD